MLANDFIPHYKRALHQQGIKALLIVQFFVVLPFMAYLPSWLLLVFVLVVIWRWRVLRGQMRKPPRLLVLLSIAIGVAGLMLSGFSSYTLDSAVSLCLLGYLLKSLEVLRRRDGIFMVYLGYFLIGVYLLYRFDPLGGLLMALLLLVNSMALQAITAENYLRWTYALRQSGFLIAGAIPVMLAAYLFFPRLPPLWHIPNDQRGVETGMTDEITPGSVAELAQSREPAFRVAFDGPIPPRNQWYWRGNTMPVFDGISWKADFRMDGFSLRSFRGSLPAIDEGATLYNYNVIMENSGRRWLYFLDWPTSISAEDSVILPDARAASVAPLTSNLRYRAVSATQVDWSESEARIATALYLPREGNLRLRQWGVDQRQIAGSDEAYVSMLLQHIRDNDFYYTLKPPLYAGRSGLEDFWFGARRGFCSHYASSVAYLLRAAGIPARLVGGYLGGKINENGGYIQVRQMEAHVWIEYWANGSWNRLDPTAAVAPSRIEQNLDGLLVNGQSLELGLLTRVNSLSALNALTMYWDSLKYQWQVMVLNYENETALGWFEDVFGRLTVTKAVIAALVLMGGTGLFLAFGTGILALPKRTPEPQRSIRRLERLLGNREAGETLRDYAVRKAALVENQADLTAVVQRIEAILYGDADASQYTRLQQDISRLRTANSDKTP